MRCALRHSSCGLVSCCAECCQYFGVRHSRVRAPSCSAQDARTAQAGGLAIPNSERSTHGDSAVCERKCMHDWRPDLHRSCSSLYVGGSDTRPCHPARGEQSERFMSNGKKEVFYGTAHPLHGVLAGHEHGKADVACLTCLNLSCTSFPTTPRMNASQSGVSRPWTCCLYSPNTSVTLHKHREVLQLSRP